MSSFGAQMTVLMILLISFIPGAYAIGMGGGTSASIGDESQVQGVFVANENGAGSTASSTGQVTLGQPIYVEDSTGKHAEVMLDVVNGNILGYRAEFSPGMGNVSAANAVSVKQTLNVKDADKITADARAWNAAGDSASVNIQVGRVGIYGAEFMGETDSSATASSAMARADGYLMGSLLGLSMAGSLVDEARDSNGGIVDCDLLMKARSASGSNLVSGKATFDVDDDWGGRIQSAVDASVDGDRVRVAPGTYNENVNVDKSLAIRGAGLYNTIVDGQRMGPVFKTGQNNSNASVVLSGMTIRNGSSEGGAMGPGTNGAGIWNHGRLSVERCKISDNEGIVSLGAGIYNDGLLSVKESEISSNVAGDGSGGGIFNDGTAALTRTRVLKNSANIGGGIYNRGNLVVVASKISENTYGGFEGQSGGIHNTGTATLINSEVSRNGGGANSIGEAHGGGISNYGTLNIFSSRISDNFVNNTMTQDSGDFGGGIYNNGTADVFASTISGNRARIGAGIYNSGSGVLKVVGSRITRNTASVTGGGIYNNGTMSVIVSTVRQNLPNNIVSAP